MSMEQLAECRRKIDILDMRLLELLNERTRIVEAASHSLATDWRLAVFAGLQH